MVLPCTEELIVPAAVRSFAGLIRAIILLFRILGVITAFTAHTGKALQPPGAPSLSIVVLARHNKPTGM